MAFVWSELKADDDRGTTVIAIDGDRNSQCAVKWAMDNLVNTKSPNCILVHVQCRTLHQGDHFNNPSKEGRPTTQQELQKMFLPYRGFCARRGIKTKEIIIHDFDVASALIGYVSRNNIANIVVGASHRNAFTRKFKHPDTPSSLLKSAPESCAVYVISKGKVQTFRLASRPHITTGPTPSNAFAHSNGSTNSYTSAHSIGSPHSPGSPHSSAHYAYSTSHNAHSPRYEHSSPIHKSSSTNCHSNESTSRPRIHWELPNFSQDSLQSDHVNQLSFRDCWKSEGFDKVFSNHSINDQKGIVSFNTFSPVASPNGHSSLKVLNEDSISDASDCSGPLSSRSAGTSNENLDLSVVSESSKNSNSSECAVNMDLLEAERRRLMLELQQSMQLLSSVTKETVLAKQMVRGLNRLQTSKGRNIEEQNVTEEAALSLNEMEKQKQIAKEAVQKVQRITEIEAQKKNEEMRGQREPVDRRKTMELGDKDSRCRRYSIDEIEIATNHFAPCNRIGEGGYGPVYKGMLNHIAVAIKILRPDLSQGQKQFQQEVEVLSNIRHPHMVILLGTCPEYGCLVYEYMENGSLEDRLFRKENTPPIPWRTRFKIAFEIAAALHFLHETKPEPLVHRDLKPANILLDCNYVSKIGDVGLARLLPPSLANDVTQYRMTAAAGTFYYIDPEYQQTGMLGVKSDLYSLGVVLLQLLTARPPMGLAYKVQDSINKGTFSEILDQSLKDWPLQEALSLGNIAVKCCELRKKDRPDLASVILPELEQLRDFSMAIEAEATEPETIIPLSSPIDLISEATSHTSEEGMRNNPNVKMENST